MVQQGCLLFSKGKCMRIADKCLSLVWSSSLGWVRGDALRWAEKLQRLFLRSLADIKHQTWALLFPLNSKHMHGDNFRTEHNAMVSVT